MPSVKLRERVGVYVGGLVALAVKGGGGAILLFGGMCDACASTHK
jgi:hypothetical protein